MNDLKDTVRIEVLHLLLREILLKKGSANSGGSLCPSDISPHCGESSSNSFPKTFSIKFPPDMVHREKLLAFLLVLMCAPCMAEILVLKVFAGGQTFFRKVLPTKYI